MIDGRTFGVHQAEPRRVPDLVREVAISLDADVVPFDIRARCDRRQINSRRVHAKLIKHLDRIDAVIPRFRHRLAVFAEHGAGDDAIVERHLPCELLGQHHHPRDPKENNVAAGDEHVGWEETLRDRSTSSPPYHGGVAAFRRRGGSLPR
ncbi:MAG: hypothetical protein IPG67_17545 [Acidobacteria bacterium]|nr:hypothetical protein [Acidobacteriota bacterium]